MAIFPGAKHLARHQAGRPPTVDLHALLERIFLQSYISAVQLILCTDVLPRSKSKSPSRKPVCCLAVITFAAVRQVSRMF